MDDFFDTEPALMREESFDEEGDFIDGEITQEDAWVVIDLYFAEKGLVKQQVDSFDRFIDYTIQEMISDSGEIFVRPERQYQTLVEV
eukprot:gene24476-30275_t